MIEHLQKSGLNRFDKISNVWCFNELNDIQQSVRINLLENAYKMFEEPIFDSIRDSDEFKIILIKLREIGKKS